MYRHSIRVTLGEHSETGAGLETDEVVSFDVTSDMLELADPWSLSAPISRDLWDLAAPDAVVRIFVDDSQILEGYVDERERALGRDDGSVLELSGRDKGGRLVDESAPLLTFDGRTIEDLAATLVAPWFPSVTLSNAKNRALVRGRGRRLAKVSGEPAIVSDRREARKVEPGETSAEVLGFFLERAQLLGWSSADGREFIIGKPNYDQAPQFFFFGAEPGSARAAETNILAATYRESCADRYTEILAVGSSRGDSANYGPNVTKRRYTAISTAIPHRKRLIVADDDIKSAAAARTRAEREMALRDGGGVELLLDVAGFGQALGGDSTTRPALFACDTMARWEDEELGIRGDYLITQVRLRRSKKEGELATLRLVPRGTELVGR